jgi:hypothetical protein
MLQTPTTRIRPIVMPPTGIEPVPQPPEGRALSPELRGQCVHGNRFLDVSQARCHLKHLSVVVLDAAIIAGRGAYAIIYLF